MAQLLYILAVLVLQKNKVFPRFLHGLGAVVAYGGHCALGHYHYTNYKDPTQDEVSSMF